MVGRTDQANHQYDLGALFTINNVSGPTSRTSRKSPYWPSSSLTMFRRLFATPKNLTLLNVGICFVHRSPGNDPDEPFRCLLRGRVPITPRTPATSLRYSSLTGTPASASENGHRRPYSEHLETAF